MCVEHIKASPGKKGKAVIRRRPLESSQCIWITSRQRVLLDSCTKKQTHTVLKSRNPSKPYYIPQKKRTAWICKHQKNKAHLWSCLIKGRRHYCHAQWPLERGELTKRKMILSPKCTSIEALGRPAELFLFGNSSLQASNAVSMVWESVIYKCWAYLSGGWEEFKGRISKTYCTRINEWTKSLVATTQKSSFSALVCREGNAMGLLTWTIPHITVLKTLTKRTSKGKCLFGFQVMVHHGSG